MDFFLQLTPVERFAVRFLESTCDYYNLEEVEDAEVRFSLIRLFLFVDTFTDLKISNESGLILNDTVIEMYMLPIAYFLAYFSTHWQYFPRIFETNFTAISIQ